MGVFTSGPAAIYVRISDDPDLQRLGVQRQERECRGLADQLGWVVDRVYEDDDRSAFRRTVVRRAYQQLLDDIRAGQWRRLIVWHPDRMHRRPAELEEFIAVVEEAGVEIATVKAGTLDLSTPSGRMVARIVGATAAYESEHKAERIRSKMAEIASTGRWKGGTRPFGWQSDGVTEVPEEVELLREAKDRILSGESVRAIAMDFDRRGVRGSRGRPMGPTGIRSLLISPRMVGLYARKDRTIVGRAVWESIFPEDEWNRLRAILTDPSRNTRARRTPRTYLLTGGLLRCGLCGSPMYGRPAFAGRPFAYYGCKKSTGYPGCGKVHMPVPQADTLVEQAVLEMLSSPDFAERRRRLVGTEPDAQGAIDELTRVKAQMQELATQYGAGTFTMVEWVEARRGLEGRLEAAERAMEAARRGAVAMLEVVSSDDLVEDWSELPIERRRAVIRTLIERVEIHPHRGGRKPDPERLRPVWRA